MRMYRGYALRLRSAVAIPGAVEIADDGRPADLEIELGDARLSVCTGRFGAFSCGPEGLLFTSPGRANYLIAANRIVVEPMQEAAVTEVIARLVATALPVWASIRADDVVLHAAGIVPPGAVTGVLVCGQSGAGKSSVARLAMRHGSALIGDDTVRVSTQGAELRASGLPGRILHGRSSVEREAHAIPADRRREGALLRRILILRTPRSSGRAYFERLRLGDALKAVLAQLHRPGAATLMNRHAHMLPLLARIARVELYYWDRPEGAGDLAEHELDMVFCRDLSANPAPIDPETQRHTP